jgi:hypothetical protein
LLFNSERSRTIVKGFPCPSEVLTKEDSRSIAQFSNLKVFICIRFQRNGQNSDYIGAV